MLTDIIRAGGTLVSERVYSERMAICQRCPNKGTVKIVGVEFDGCTVCGCPFATKLRADWHALDGGKVKCPQGKW